MSRTVRMPRKYNTARKYKGKCEYCQKVTPIHSIFQYIDESNWAITHNSPYLCKECYEKQYGKKVQ